MLNITLIYVGKLKEKYLKDACQEYSKRLGSFCKLNLVEINEYKLPDNPSSSEIEKCIEKEGEAIIAKIPKSSYVFTLCIEGKLISSEELAEKFLEIANNSVSSVVFIIGGSYGLSKQVKATSDFKLSMSKMTFPHQLARVMVLEQIYRAMGINSNSKYHK